jgi:hypothetical protein
MEGDSRIQSVPMSLPLTDTRLFFNALSPSAAETLVHLEGDVALGLPLLRARSVIV